MGSPHQPALVEAAKAWGKPVVKFVADGRAEHVTEDKYKLDLNAENEPGIFKWSCFPEPIKDVLKPIFKTRLEVSSWLHYHGHTGSIRSDPFKQSYPLTSTESIDDGNLTVAEILDLRLRGSPAVAATACSSSVQDSSQANEQLGLTSSLIIAGAATVIGTLWLIRNITGQEYAKYFYDALYNQMANAKSGESYINLAEANRQATIRLKKYRGKGDGNGRFVKPSDWGTFVLYGSPFFKLSTVTGSLPPLTSGT